jgi:ubiquinone biosynthesis monooxygenase Coq7
MDAIPRRSQSLTPLDRLLSSADHALRTIAGATKATRVNPADAVARASDQRADAELTDDQKRLSGALMRVNHVGEVCAQALYQAQALTSRTPELRAQLEQAAVDEMDHLAWTQQRLQELGDRTSWLTPLWYGGAFGIGVLAGCAGDRVSLGFVVETERQVEAHLDSHLDRLPEQDTASRAIVECMRDDEARHAHEAQVAGGISLPLPVRWMMRATAKVMTTTAHRI